MRSEMTAWYVRVNGGHLVIMRGDRDAIMDAFYDAGALAVTILPVRP